MRVICTDGTVFPCESYDLNDHGVVLYGQEEGDEDERYDEEREQIGFVPHWRLSYVLPDDVTPGAGPASDAPQQMPNGQAPYQGGGHQQGGAPPQQRPPRESQQSAPSPDQQ